MSDDTGLASILASSVVSGCLHLGTFFQGGKDSERGNNNTLQGDHDPLATTPGPDGDGQHPSHLLLHSSNHSGEFLSDLIAQLWPLLRVAAAGKIREQIEPTFATLPGPLATLAFVKIDLGHAPLRLDNLVVHEMDQQQQQQQTLQCDMDLVWDGTCDIRLKAVFGKFGVKSVKVFGRLSILLKPLHAQIPIVQAIQVAFINPPQIALDFSGLANLVDVDVLRRKMYHLLQTMIRKQMVLPQRRLVKLDTACRFFDIYQPPLGILRVRLRDGNGFVVEDRGPLRPPDIPDCYVLATLGDTQRRSRTIPDNTRPVWNETMDFLLCDHDQILHLEVLDYDSGAFDQDDFLGQADVTIRQLLLEGGTKQIHLLDEHGKLNNSAVVISCERLELTSDLASLTASRSTNTKNDSSTNEICGLLTILIGQVFRLPVEKEQISAFVKVEYNNQFFLTPVVNDYPGLDSLNPFFDSAFHVPLMTADLFQRGHKIKDIVFHLMNQKVCIGTTKVTHEMLVQAPRGIVTQTCAVGSQGARLEYSVSLRGVAPSSPHSSWHKPATATSLPTSGLLQSLPHQPTTTPTTTGIKKRVLVTIVKATGFQTQRFRHLFQTKDDVADPYCIIKYGSDPTPWRTQTILNQLSPTWNESHSFIFLNHSQIIHMEVYDDNSARPRRLRRRRTTDNLLGVSRVTVGKVLLAGGSLEVEANLESNPTGIFVTVACALQDDH